MTSWAEMATAVRSRLAATLPSVPVQYDNQVFEPPDASSWVRWTLQPAGVLEPEFGTYQTTGRGVALIFVPMGLGVQAALALADTITDAFKLIGVAGLTWHSPVCKTVGRSGKWWQVNVECPFNTEDQD